MRFFGYSREEWLEVVPVLSERRLKILAPYFRRNKYFVYMCLPAQVPNNPTVLTDKEMLELLPYPYQHSFRRIAADRRRLCQTNGQ